MTNDGAQKMRRWLAGVVIVHLIAIGVFVQLYRDDRGDVSTHDVSAVEMSIAKKSPTTPGTTSATTSSFYFHPARPDRSGAVLEDMLLAHAHSFYNNLSYGGACATVVPMPHQASHNELIRLLGLQHQLKFACPAAVDNSSNTTSPLLLMDHHKSDSSPIHRRFNTRIFRHEWLALMRGEHLRYRNLPPPSTTTTTTPKTAVIHIRRGDVSLCDPNTADRYLPNQHYVSLIESLTKGSNDDINGGVVPLAIEIYSEQRSEPEGWEDLLQQLASSSSSSSVAAPHRLSLHLNATASLVWSRLIQADVLVLSKSSFSFVPAIFATATSRVVYTPFWLDSLPHWTIVDENLMQTTRRANIRLRHELCQNNSNNNTVD
jgi:hypothetical protein